MGPPGFDRSTKDLDTWTHQTWMLGTTRDLDTWIHWKPDAWVPGYLLAVAGAKATISQLVALQVHNVFGLVGVPTALADDQGLVQEEAVPGDRDRGGTGFPRPLHALGCPHHCPGVAPAL